MFRLLSSVSICLVLAACNGAPSDGASQPAPIANGVAASAAPILFFQQGVTGQTRQDAAIVAAQFQFTCDSTFANGKSLQERANASAQYSRLAREKVTGWLLNSMVKRSIMREVSALSTSQQGCAPTNILFNTQTTDPVEVAKFSIENNLLPRIMALPR